MSSSTVIRNTQRLALDWIVGQFPAIGLDKRAEDFVSIFERFVPEKSRALDIGGGWGFYVEPLKRSRNCDVTVLDVIQPGFRKSPVVVYGGNKIPFPDKSFDVSLLITVLHHMEEPEKVLAEARRVTRNWVIVIEDLYRTAVGRFWTVLRDSLFNLEFIGHPRQFRSKEHWFSCFKKLGYKVEWETEVFTHLLGLKIRNGLFVLGTQND